MSVKTYSVAIHVKATDGDYWVTNWGQHFNLSDIDFVELRQFVDAHPEKYLGYGYYYGTNSRSLTSAKCRTVLYERE